MRSSPRRRKGSAKKARILNSSAKSRKNPPRGENEQRLDVCFRCLVSRLELLAHGGNKTEVVDQEHHRIHSDDPWSVPRSPSDCRNVREVKTAQKPSSFFGRFLFKNDKIFHMKMTEGAESSESLEVSTKILNSGELKGLIYKGDSLPADQRFSRQVDGGVFKYFDARTFDHRDESKFFPVVLAGETVAGICELEKSPYNENRYWIKFISIDPKYQNRGYSSLLLEEIFKFVKERNAELQLSFFSPDGELKLKKVLARLSEQYSIPLIPHIETAQEDK